MTDDLRDPRLRWSDTEAGTAYAGERWAREGRRQRDPRNVEALLRAHLDPDDHLRAQRMILDAPCGTGRLRDVLLGHGRYVGLDYSPAMLREAVASGGETHGANWARGDLEELPFRDASFEVVVCCRILHHLADRERFQSTVQELVRVSSKWVLATFWDAGSLPAWRRRAFAKPRPSGRTAHPKRWVENVFDEAGAEVVAWRHSLRFLSQQTYVLARRKQARR